MSDDRVSVHSIVRSLVWRLGRRAYLWARGEGNQHPERNGEYWILRELPALADGAAVHVLDIGANVGEWTSTALRAFSEAKVPVIVHAVEPAERTVAVLRDRFSGDSAVRVYHQALSDTRGVVPFYVVSAGAGTNTLSRVDGSAVETVQAETLDAFLDTHGIGAVLFAKIDTEGHDLNVLRGAQGALRAGRFAGIQFEYNHRWLNTGATLKATFELINGTPYKIAKLLGKGMYVIDEWHPELERFFECNYVLVHTGGPLHPLARPAIFDSANVLRPAPSTATRR